MGKELPQFLNGLTKLVTESRRNVMPENNDPGVQTVLDNMETIVSSEGGSLDFISLDDSNLVVRYNKGINEECPECVPNHEMVKMMITGSLGIYAPHVTKVNLL